MTVSRTTRQRSALAELLERTSEFRSAQQLHAMLGEQGESVSLATVYRNLSALAEAGEVDALAAPGGETRYRRCRRTEHHHHLVCRRCGRTVEVAETAVERWAAQTARRHGFTEVSHAIELHGTCEACRRDA
ncbi:Fur family transcriptional regulator [Kocuria rosea]|uniref:Fur family transcriptional regulator n=1 Tax=Kocuria rosea TaxID=1275 RepID=UPI000D6575D5|nr:transcriptional repressor [Kocuria rosea]PWF80369.1 transcriptional repressor [Kocuria rosea]